MDVIDEKVNKEKEDVLLKVFSNLEILEVFSKLGESMLFNHL